MRLDKTQVNPIVKITTPNLTDFGFFDKTKYEMVGYKNYEVMLVGGGGGDSGKCTSATDYVAYKAGGGGGSTIRVGGLLANLFPLTAYWVGAAGEHGYDAGDGQYPGSGDDGRATQWGGQDGTDCIARGGLGGLSGTIDRMAGGTSWQRSEGGDGGTPDPDLGTGGGGGLGNGSNGNWGTSGIFSGSRGGGGAEGKMKINGVIQEVAGNGGDGCVGGGSAFASGQDQWSSNGGRGGGGDIEPLTGVSEKYGSYATGSNPGGVLVIKMS